MPRDQIFALPIEKIGQFTFDEEVVKVFPDMIKRSVPGYASVLSMISVLGNRYCEPGTRAYDLGCSLGTGTFLLQQAIPGDCAIYAVDNSSSMLDELNSSLTQRPGISNVHTILADICDLDLQPARFVMMNWTMQFVPEAEREDLVAKIFRSLEPGGALMLSEKIVAEDSGSRDLLIDLHHGFKAANGYSELEIAQKRTSLENLLVPETAEQHLQRLRSSGFDDVCIWFQCFNFASFLAVKK